MTLLDIGVNSASTPPDVPDAFVWKDAGGASVIMLYHRKAYGGVIKIPKSDLAIAVEMRDDNAGPHTVDEIHQIYTDLKQQFPGATIQAANLTDIANAVEPFKAALPVVTAEIGDTWIYGVASDPVKLARIRELVRLRKSWIQQKQAQSQPTASDLAFLSKFALAVEHTWGTDTKTWLDFNHYTPDDLASKLDDPKYRTVTGSWVEKRNDIDEAVAGLPDELREEAQSRLAGSESGGSARPPRIWQRISQAIRLPPLTSLWRLIRIPERLSICATRKGTGRRPSIRLALLSYQTLSKADYDKFLASYITVQTDWAPKDFGKPNIESFGAQSRLWTPKLTNCWAGEMADVHRMVARLQFGPQEHRTTAWPQDCYLDLLFSKTEPSLEVHLKWFGKRSNRMPEALWLTFNPAVFEAQNWSLSKMGQKVSPFEVVSGGNRHMHVVESLAYKDARGSFELEPLDAGLVTFGDRTPIYFSKQQPDLSRGLHFSLFNNGWGTNYIQWFGEDMRFRFVLRLA